MAPVLDEFVMKMRGRSEPGHTHAADHLVLFHSDARPYPGSDASHVGIAGLDAGGVTNLYDPAVTAIGPGRDYGARGGCVNRRSGICGVIDATMCPANPQNGMNSRQGEAG